MTRKEIIVWGLPKHETETWKETLLSETCRNAADVAKVKVAASKDGWHSFRVSQYNGEAPDFSKTVTA